MPEVRELEPSAIKPSPYLDRSGEPDDEATFLTLVNSMRDSGQQVPILVVPHGAEYICVYGHRRVRAARRLDVKVKALVADLDPEAAVAAQGLENAARLELTFIEKARFARRLERDGADRLMIARVMALDPTTVSKSMQVVASIGESVLDRIGRAPTIGRGRWEELAALLTSGKPKTEVRRKLAKTIYAQGFQDLPSQERFGRLLRALKEAPATPVRRPIMSRDGRQIARVVAKGDGSCTIQIGSDREGFSALLVEALPRLFDELMPATGATL